MSETSPTTARLSGEVRVCGGSDDLICLSGAIREEWLHYGPGPARLTFDNGVVLDVEYGHDGIWRTTVIAEQSSVRVLTCPDPTGEDTYSDTAIVTGVRAVTCASPTGDYTATTHRVIGTARRD